MRLFIIALLFAISYAQTDCSAEICCDVAVLGGGMGGLYSAYKLLQLTSDSVCIFERNDYWGGRFKSVAFDDLTTDDGSTIDVGHGGIRIPDSHHMPKHLAAELGIKFHFEPYGDMKTIINGNTYDDMDDAAVEFSLDPLIVNEICGDCSPPDCSCYDLLWESSHLIDYRNHPLLENSMSTEDYLTAVLGAEGEAYMQATFRYRADYADNVDAETYMEFVDFEGITYDYETPVLMIGYPEGSADEFPKRLHAACEGYGERFVGYLDQAVTSLSSSSEPDYNFAISTVGHSVLAKKVVNNIDPTGFASVTGNVAEALKAMPEFQDVLPVPVTTIQQSFATRFWESIGEDYPEWENIGRIQTTDTCLNLVEIADMDGYLGKSNSIRSVYADGYCANWWKNLYENSDPQMSLDDLGEIVRQHLETAYNTDYDPPQISIPSPLRTTYHYWPNAWHFQKVHGDNSSLPDIRDWAKSAYPDLVMVGEAWHPYRAWVIGALISAQEGLKALYPDNEYLQATLVMEDSSESLWPNAAEATTDGAYTCGATMEECEAAYVAAQGSCDAEPVVTQMVPTMTVDSCDDATGWWVSNTMNGLAGFDSSTMKLCVSNGQYAVQMLTGGPAYPTCVAYVDPEAACTDSSLVCPENPSSPGYAGYAGNHRAALASAMSRADYKSPVCPTSTCKSMDLLAESGTYWKDSLVSSGAEESLADNVCVTENNEMMLITKEGKHNMCLGWSKMPHDTCDNQMFLCAGHSGDGSFTYGWPGQIMRTAAVALANANGDYMHPQCPLNICSA